MLRAREGPHRARDWPHLLLGDGLGCSMMRACAKEVCAGCGLPRTLGLAGATTMSAAAVAEASTKGR